MGKAKMKMIFLESKANCADTMLTIDSLSLSKSKNYSPKTTEDTNSVFTENVSPMNVKSRKRITLVSTARKSQRLNGDMAIGRISNEKVTQSKKEQDSIFHSIPSDILNVPEQLNILLTNSQNKKREKLRNDEKWNSKVAVNFDQNNLPSQCENVEVSGHVDSLEGQTPILSTESKKSRKQAIPDLGSSINKKSLRSAHKFSSQNKFMSETFPKQMNQRIHDKIPKFNSANKMAIQGDIFCGQNFNLNKKSENILTENFINEPNNFSLDKTVYNIQHISVVLHRLPDILLEVKNIRTKNNPAKPSVEDQNGNRRIVFSSKDTLQSHSEVTNDKSVNKKVEHSDVPNVLAFKISRDLKQKSKKRVLSGVKSVSHDNQVNISKNSSLLPKNSNLSLETKSVNYKKQSSPSHEVYEPNYSTSISKVSKNTLKKYKKPSLSSSKKYSKDSFSNNDLRSKNSQIFKCITNSKVVNQGKISGAESLSISEVFIDNAEHSSEASDYIQSKKVQETSHSLDLSCQLEEDTVLALSKTNCKKSKSRSCSQNFRGNLIQKNYISISKSCKKHKKYCDYTKNISSKNKSLSCVKRHTGKRVTKSLCHKKRNSECKASYKFSNKTLQKNTFDLKNISIDFLSLSPYIPKGRSKKHKLAVGD